VTVPAPFSKPVNPLKQKRVMSADHKAKLSLALKKARDAKAKKLTGVK